MHRAPPSCLAAGATALLQDRSTPATLFAPLNSAWAKVPASVDLTNMATLQKVRCMVAGGLRCLPACLSEKGGQAELLPSPRRA